MRGILAKDPQQKQRNKTARPSRPKLKLKLEEEAGPSHGQGAGIVFFVLANLSLTPENRRIRICAIWVDVAPPWLRPSGRSSMVTPKSGIFGARETHGRALRAENRLIAHSPEVGWRALY